MAGIEGSISDSNYRKAVTDNQFLLECIQGVSPERKKMEQRETYSPLLIKISEENPEVLYNYWDTFVDYIKSDNGFSQYVGIYVLAHLTRIDAEKKFDKMLDSYFDLLKDKSVMVASHTALNALKIIKAKPDLEPKITERLLQIDSLGHTPNHRELIKSYIIDTFCDYFRSSAHEKEIIEFVKAQRNSISPKTRKLAEKFLKTNDYE